MDSVLSIIVAFVLIALAESISQTSRENGPCLIYTNGVCLPKEEYNRHMPSESPVVVNVSFKLEQLEGINEARSEIDFVGILGLYWKETRFIYSNETDIKHQSFGIPLNIHWIKSMWIPDLYIYQMRTVTTHELLAQPYMGICK